MPSDRSHSPVAPSPHRRNLRCFLAALIGVMMAGCGVSGEKLAHALSGYEQGRDAGMPVDHAAPLPCGDGSCEGGEDCLSCPEDCDCGDALVCGVGGSCEEAVTCGDTACPTPPPGFGAAGCNEAGACVARNPDTAEDDDRMLWVPATTFRMGSEEPAGTYDADWPAHDVQLASGYWIDRTEVTAASFATFLTGRGSNDCAGVSCADDDVSTRFVNWSEGEASVRDVCQRQVAGPANESCASHPVVEVTWQGAETFCRETGRRLCTEAEWEHAARPSGTALYPWGPESPEGRANCLEDACSDGYERTAPVGSLLEDESWTGCLDMAGNVWEWVADDWHESYGPSADDVAHPQDGSAWVDSPRASDRVGRGGSYRSVEADGRVPDMEVTRRHDVLAVSSPEAGGVRCCW